MRIYVHSLEMAMGGWVGGCGRVLCGCVCHEELKCCVEIDLSLCSMPPIYCG